MPAIDYLDPERSGDFQYQLQKRTQDLDRELGYDMSMYGGDQNKIFARQLRYGAERSKLIGDLNAGVAAGKYDPWYGISALPVQRQQYLDQAKQKQAAQDEEQQNLVASGRDYIGGAELYSGYDAQLKRQNDAMAAGQARAQKFRTPVGWSDQAPAPVQYSGMPSAIKPTPLSNPYTSYTGQGGNDLRNAGNHGYMVPMTVEERMASGTANPRDAESIRAAQMRQASRDPYAR